MFPKLESSGSHVGFQYCVIVMPMGHRCGYVLIPENHPWYGKSLNDPIFRSIDVHGGVSFSNTVKAKHFDGMPYECPWPSFGHWVGFDCAHFGDQPDFDEMSPQYRQAYKEARKLGEQLAKAFLRSIGMEREDWQGTPPEFKRKIRHRIFVEGQCKQLAAQAQEAERRP